jgi:hypothetical protein
MEPLRGRHGNKLDRERINKITISYIKMIALYISVIEG